MFIWMQSSGFPRLMAGFLALVVINLSVDSPDYTSAELCEDLALNEQESIVEILLEQVMGIENAIPEHDDPHQNDAVKKPVLKLAFRFEMPEFMQSGFHVVNDTRSIANLDERSSYAIYLEKFSPPPEV